MLKDKRVREIIKEELSSFVDKNKDNEISHEEILNVIDTNKDGKINSQELDSAVSWYCNNPHIIKPFEKIRMSSHQSVPCQTTYDKAAKHLMKDIDGVYGKSYQDIQLECGAECPVSVMTAVLDILRSLENIER